MPEITVNFDATARVSISKKVEISDDEFKRIQSMGDDERYAYLVLMKDTEQFQEAVSTVNLVHLDQSDLEPKGIDEDSLTATSFSPF